MAVVYTNKGHEMVASEVNGTDTGTHYIGAGTGSAPGGTFTPASNALITEVAEARVAATKSLPAADKNQWKATQTYTSQKTITNAGVASALTSGNFFILADGLSLLMNAGDSIEYTFTLLQTS